MRKIDWSREGIQKILRPYVKRNHETLRHVFYDKAYPAAVASNGKCLAIIKRKNLPTWDLPEDAWYPNYAVVIPQNVILIKIDSALLTQQIEVCCGFWAKREERNDAIVLLIVAIKEGNPYLYLECKRKGRRKFTTVTDPAGGKIVTALNPFFVRDALRLFKRLGWNDVILSLTDEFTPIKMEAKNSDDEMATVVIATKRI